MDASARKAITLPMLSAAMGANPQSLRNALYLRLPDFRSAIRLPAYGREKQNGLDVFRLSHCFLWWVVVVSNHWPPPCEGGALPLS